MAQATQDHLAADVEHLRESDRQLAVDIREIAAGLASVRTELRLVWRIGGGIAALFGSVLLWTAGQTFGLAGRVGELSAEVRANAVQANQRFDQVEKNVNQRFDQVEKNVDQRFDQVEKNVDQRCDQVEKNVNQRFDQLEKRMDKTDARFDRLEAKVDQGFGQIMQRLDQVVPKKGGG